MEKVKRLLKYKKDSKNILVYGESGVGKTYSLSKIMKEEGGVRIDLGTTSTIKMIGKRLKSEASLDEKGYIFFDNLESLIYKGSYEDDDTYEDLIYTLIEILDRRENLGKAFRDIDKNFLEKVVIVASSDDTLEKIPKELKERFESRVKIELPSEEKLEELYKEELVKRKNQFEKEGGSIIIEGEVFKKLSTLEISGGYRGISRNIEKLIDILSNTYENLNIKIGVEDIEKILKKEDEKEDLNRYIL